MASGRNNPSLRGVNPPDAGYDAHIKVHWIHDFADEPILIYSEIRQGLETRKVECYRDGRRDFASAEGSSGSTVLADGVMPTLREIASDGQFKPEPISPEEFEHVWAEAVTE